MWRWLKFRGRDRSDEEVGREIRAHLELEAEERSDAGVPPEEAGYAARRAFGNVSQAQEAAGDVWLSSGLERLMQDLRFTLRTMRKSPLYTVVALLTLALGIGANTAIFSVVNGVLLKPLPYRDPGRLVTLLDHGNSPISMGNFVDWRRESRSYEAMAAAELWSATLTGGEHAEQVSGLHLSQGMFEMLGVPPALGRTPSAEDFRPGHGNVIVLSYPLWQGRFGGDPAVLGRAITLSNEPYTVIGVMPAQFRFAPFWATNVRMWAPMWTPDLATERGGRSLRVFARLKRGVTREEAQAEMDGISARLERSYPKENAGIRIPVMSLEEKSVGKVRPLLLVLLGAVTFVLLIACANVANLALARTAERQKEIAIRRAMGASWSRVLRQFLTESLLLSCAGGALGTLSAVWVLSLLKAFVRESASQFSSLLPQIDQVTLDVPVLLFTVALSIGTGILFGFAPAIQAAGAELSGSLKEGGRGASEGRSGGGLRRMLVVVEVAVSLVLLAGAGLLVRSFLNLRNVDPGFDPRGVLSMTISVAGQAQYCGRPPHGVLPRGGRCGPVGPRRRVGEPGKSPADRRRYLGHLGLGGGSAGAEARRHRRRGLSHLHAALLPDDEDPAAAGPRFYRG